jgi:hypothetical protein
MDSESGESYDLAASESDVLTPFESLGKGRGEPSG